MSAAQVLPDSYTAAGGRPAQATRELIIISSIRRSAGRLSPRLNTEMQSFADSLEQKVIAYMRSSAFEEHMAAECAAATATLEATVARHDRGDSVDRVPNFTQATSCDQELLTRGWAVVVMWAGVARGVRADDPVYVLDRWVRFHNDRDVGNDYALIAAIPAPVAALAVAVGRLDRERPVCSVLGVGGTAEAMRSAAKLAQERLLQEGIRRMRPVRACVQSYVDACQAIDPPPAD